MQNQFNKAQMPKDPSSQTLSPQRHEKTQQLYDSQVSDLQSDLKNLIQMEPYAHRARQL